VQNDFVERLGHVANHDRTGAESELRFQPRKPSGLPQAWR
jgi:hypothetical protein